jgi:two-component system, OmpR family, KDP operon response regulator KdpE
MSRVLVVDDDPLIVKALVVNMRARGYDVHTASDGASALRVAGLNSPDVVILDLGLPDMEGTAVIAGLRGWTAAPIVVLTGRTEQIQKVAALDSGADDYVTKPFGIEELLARMRAVSRRVTAERAPTTKVGEWVVDLNARRVRPARGAGDDQKLTPTEWRILEILVRNPGRLITKLHLLHEVWGPGYDTETNYLRLYLAQLRRKLEPNPARPTYLLTETGIGYRFEPGDSDTHRSSSCAPTRCPLTGSIHPRGGR